MPGLIGVIPVVCIQDVLKDSRRTFHNARKRADLQTCRDVAYAAEGQARIVPDSGDHCRKCKVGVAIP
jgi:hypothetical protein